MIKGVFTSDQNIQAARKGDFAASLLRTHPTGSATLLALSSGMPSKSATDSVVVWFEKNHATFRTTITNNIGTGTSGTVADGSQVMPNTMYLVESTGEMLYIEAVTGNAVTVTRGLGGTTVTAIDGSSTPVPVQRISTAFEESSDRPAALANVGFPRLNWVQRFRNAWSVSGTAQAIEYHTGSIVAENKRDCALFHAEDIERAMHFSVKSIGTLNGQLYHTMDGIRTQISTNVQAQATNVTWDDLDLFLENVFSYNIKGKPNERIAFCGNTVVRVLNKIARLEGTIELMTGETEFGLEVTKWRTPFGRISLMTHPLYNENPTWSKDLVVLHPGAFQTRWLRKTFWDNYDKEGTRAGVDADFGVLTSELSCVYMAERTAGIYTGIDTAAASA